MTLPAVLAGAVAGVVLALVEVVWLRIAIPAALPPVGGTLGLMIAIVPRGFVVGAALGLLEGLSLALFDWLARRPGRRRLPETNLFAALTALPIVIGVVALARPLLRGHQARWFTDHPLVLSLIGVSVAWCIYEVVLLARLAPGFVRSRRDERAARATWRWIAAVLLLVAGSAYLVDRLVLVRLYEPFHLGLRAIAFVSLQVALLAACAIWSRPGIPFRLPRWLGASFAIVSVGLSLAHVREPAAARIAAVNLVRLHGAVAGSVVSLAETLIRQNRPRVDRGRGPVVPEHYGDHHADASAPLAPTANILLITVDALRADHLEPFGYHRPTTPRLKALASESVVFERAYTSAPHTSFALASLLTGRPAMSLSERGLLDDVPTIADLARVAGYRTAAFFPPAVFFVDGDRFRSFERRGFGFEHTFAENLPETSAAPLMTDQVIRYLADWTPERFFIWAHYFAPHEPYVDHEGGPPPFGKSAVDRYDGEIRWVDREIGRLVDSVRAHHPNTIVAITADHGEEFGDHGGAYHGTTLFDEQVRVPLIISIPDVEPRRVRSPVSTASITPTLLNLVGAKADASFDGIDLMPAIGDERDLEPQSVVAENAQHRMIVSGTEKLICETRTDSCALFDLSSDPKELIDLSPTRTERAGTMRALLEAWVARQDESRGQADRWARLQDPQSPRLSRLAAARSIARRPDRTRVQTLRAAWDREPDPSVKAWLAVSLVALGDSAARVALPGLVSEATELDDELLAHAALARARLSDPNADVALASTLPRTEDVNLRCALMHALAKRRTPLAASALLNGYEAIRSRICCAAALHTLRDPTTVPFILSRLPDEPYTSVQTALVRALGTIGDPAAVPMLRSLRGTTSEAELAHAIDAILPALERNPPGT